MEWVIANWENIGLGLMALDIIVGALPDKYCKYPSAILKVAHELYVFGKIEK